jgi:predicted  nucleic acid-binding Zn-ribbon protein
MDPDATYDEIIDLRHKIERLTEQAHSEETQDVRKLVAEIAQAGADLAEKFEHLDEWLQNGGFLPGVWER